jgi:hypothetical protein
MHREVFNRPRALLSIKHNLDIAHRGVEDCTLRKLLHLRSDHSCLAFFLCRALVQDIAGVVARKSRRGDGQGRSENGTDQNISYRSGIKSGKGENPSSFGERLEKM